MSFAGVEPTLSLNSENCHLVEQNCKLEQVKYRKIRLSFFLNLTEKNYKAIFTKAIQVQGISGPAREGIFAPRLPKTRAARILFLCLKILGNRYADCALLSRSCAFS